MSTSEIAITGRAHPDDEALVRADLKEFYDAGLSQLADAAVHWVATGEDYEALQEETERVRAIAITAQGPGWAKNKLDEVLVAWGGPWYNAEDRPRRSAFFMTRARYEPLCQWRYGVLLAGDLWRIGYYPQSPRALAQPVSFTHDILSKIDTYHWRQKQLYASLELKDLMLQSISDALFPALEHYTGRKDPLSSHTIAKSEGAAEYLTRNATGICGRFNYSDTLAAALTELGVVRHGYTEWIVSGLKGEPKRRAAKSGYVKTNVNVPISALATIPEDVLAAQLADCFREAEGPIAIALIDLLSLRGGDAGRDLLRERLQTEKASAVREAIELALRVERPAVADDEHGYAALDDSRIAIPPVKALDPEYPCPDSVRDDIERCRRQINQELAARYEQSKRWHDDAVARGETRTSEPRAEQSLGEETVEAILRTMREGPAPPSVLGAPYNAAEYRLRRGPSGSWEAKVKGWSARPIHLLQLLRLAQTDQLDMFARAWTSSIAEGEVGRRLAGSLDLRTLRDAMAILGRTPRPPALEAYEHLPAENIWPYFAERMDAIEQAFANGAELQAMAALSRFPKTPQRFVPALINLALSEKRTHWAPAQRLLGDEKSLTPLILPQLASKAAERRRVAAQWLGKRGDVEVIKPLREVAAKEKSAPVYAAILMALKSLGADLAEYFDEAKLLAAAEESLAAKEPDQKGWFPLEALPDLFWADGRPLKRALARHWLLIANDLKLTSGNAQIDLYLDQLAPASATKWGLFTLEAWIARDTAPLSEADLQALGAEVFKQHQAYPATRFARFDSTYLYFDHLDEVTPAACVNVVRQHFAGRVITSAYENRGLLAIAARAPAVDMVRLIRPYLKEHYKRMGQCKVLLDCLAANGAPAALQLIFATATASKNKGVQKHASALVDMLAEARGWTRDELADRTVPTAGLDETGALELPIAGKTYVSRLGQDLTLTLFNADGAKIAALPAPKEETAAAEAKEAKGALTAAKKELKQTVEMQAGRFYEALCGEREWSADDFKTLIQQHPILARLAERLIWVSLDADHTQLEVFRPLGDGTLSDAYDKPTTLEGAAFVKLAHLAAIGADDAEAWLRHFADYEVTPLFPQLTRPRRALPPELGEADMLEDRQGWAMDTFKLRAAAAKVGWKRGPIIDGGGFESYEKALPGMGLTAVLSFSGSMVPEQNVPAALHGVNFQRTRANGPSATIALADVPMVLLSEVWNDYHDIAAAGAFDPKWQDICPW